MPAKVLVGGGSDARRLDNTYKSLTIMYPQAFESVGEIIESWAVAPFQILDTALFPCYRGHSEGALGQELSAFVESVAKSETPPITGEDGLRALKFLGKSFARMDTQSRKGTH